MSFQKVLVFNSSLLAHPCKRVAGELVAPLVLKVPIVTTQARIRSSLWVGSHQGRPAQCSCRRKSSEGYADNGTCRRRQRPNLFRDFPRLRRPRFCNAQRLSASDIPSADVSGGDAVGPGMLNAFWHRISLRIRLFTGIQSRPRIPEEAPPSSPWTQRTAPTCSWKDRLGLS